MDGNRPDLSRLRQLLLEVQAEIEAKLNGQSSQTPGRSPQADIRAEPPGDANPADDYMEPVNRRSQNVRLVYTTGSQVNQLRRLNGILFDVTQVTNRYGVVSVDSTETYENIATSTNIFYFYFFFLLL